MLPSLALIDLNILHILEFPVDGRVESVVELLLLHSASVGYLLIASSIWVREVLILWAYGETAVDALSFYFLSVSSFHAELGRLETRYEQGRGIVFQQSLFRSMSLLEVSI